MNGPQFAQLLQADAPPLNMALPTWVEQGCRLTLTLLPEGGYAMDVQLLNPSAEMLLRYRERGFLKQAATLSTSESLTAETLLLRKGADPISAVVGAYALLRFGDLERLHDWTENLKNNFRWLPDGLTLRAEHHARLGEHAQALDLLLDLPTRGLPYFSEGLSYAVDRLRVYQALGEKHFPAEKISQARQLLQRLQRFATYVDFSRPILAFTGLDLTQPDRAPLDDVTLATTDGLHVLDYLI